MGIYSKNKYKVGDNISNHSAVIYRVIERSYTDRNHYKSDISNSGNSEMYTPTLLKIVGSTFLKLLYFFTGTIQEEKSDFKSKKARVWLFLCFI